MNPRDGGRNFEEELRALDLMEAGISEESALEMFEFARAQRASAHYHGQMRRKYERAARYPWLTVAPDPPVPE